MKYIRKSISILLAMLLVSADAGYGAAFDGAIIRGDCNKSAGDFYLPESLGKIVLSSRNGDIAQAGGDNRLIIHIQDAHSDYSIQRKITDIVAFLNKRYGINQINLEGGAGYYDFSAFTKIDNIPDREKVTDSYVKDGEISGAEFYGIMHPDKINVWGAEDSGLYLEDLRLYRIILKDKGRIDGIITGASKTLESLSKDVFTADMLSFTAERNKYTSWKLSIKEYAPTLKRYADMCKVDIEKFLTIKQLFNIENLENEIDFKNAKDERYGLINTLKDNLSKYELGEFYEILGRVKDKEAGDSEFYSFILYKALCLGIDSSSYANFKKYVFYSDLYKSIDEKTLMREVGELENSIIKNLSGGKRERALATFMSNMEIIRDMFNLNLSRERYEYYLGNKMSFSMAFLNSFAGKGAKPNDDISLIDKYMSYMEKFYECSMRRDKAFIKNLKYQTISDRLKVAVLVTGGFHTENLASLAEKENITLISIMPSGERSSSFENHYLDLLKGRSTIAIASPNSRLGW